MANNLLLRSAAKGLRAGLRAAGQTDGVTYQLGSEIFEMCDQVAEWKLRYQTVSATDFLSCAKLKWMILGFVWIAIVFEEIFEEKSTGIDCSLA